MDEVYVISGSSNYTIDFGGNYLISPNYRGTINIATTDAVTIDGVEAGNLEYVYIVTDSESADLTLKDLTITNHSNGFITFGRGVDNKLTISGESVLRTYGNNDIALINIGGGLTIDGDGYLELEEINYYGGAGIGTDASETSDADITISGGKLKITSKWGAGIGSGNEGSVGNITINGDADILIDGYCGAGIGTGSTGTVGDILIGGNAKIETISDNGSGIGSGSRGGTVGSITINGNADVIATGGSEAGIGGTRGTVGDITIGGDSNIVAFGDLGITTGNNGAITFSGATSTADKSNVTIYNNNSYSNVTINGQNYSGAKLVFEDGTYSGGSDGSGMSIVIGGTYRLNKNFAGTITIDTTSAVTIDGSALGAANNINIVTNSATADLTIRNLNITDSFYNNIIKFGSGAGNKLTLEGENSFVNTKGTSSAGIYVGGGLTIDGTGSLNVEVTGTVTAIGLNFSEESSADIIINGGTITATSNDYSGAAIGSGVQGSIGNIVIGGTANVTATTTTSGAGIGTALFGSAESITIKDNAVVNATSVSGAGIGSGGHGSVGKITIQDNANVTSFAELYGAGIGAGNGGTAEDIEITGNAVVNSKGQFGAGIGSGEANGGNNNVPSSTSTAGNITIDGNAQVTAISGQGAGIGAGSAYWGFTNVGNISIGGSAIVDAKSEKIGGGVADGYGTGIGIGYTGYDSKSTLGDISIGGDATVTASASGYNGIGLGARKSDYSSGVNEIGTISISGDTSTDAQSKVTINNSATTREITINGKNYSGEQLIFTDGEIIPAGISVSNGVLSIGAAFTGDSVNLDDYSVTKATASALSRGISITGSATADSIRGGSGADTIFGTDGNDTIHGGNNNDAVYGEAGNDRLYGDNGADILYGADGNDTLDGGNGNDVIYGGTGSDKLMGNNGNDTLYGGAGNDTLTGGNGSDIFVYEGGNDIITDYRAGADKIQLASGKISRSSISGANVIFTVDSGKITVRGGRGKNITVINSNGVETTQKYSSATLFSDDNFISGENNLDAITAKNFAVTNLQPEEKTVALAENLSIAAYSEN